MTDIKAMTHAKAWIKLCVDYNLNGSSDAYQLIDDLVEEYNNNNIVQIYLRDVHNGHNQSID